MDKNVDEKDARLQRHLKNLEANHASEFEERFGTEKSRKKVQQEQISDEISAHWNAQQKGKAHSIGGAPVLKPLPENWRDEHWKKLQAMAEEYAGVEAKNKAESVAALDAYEARLTAQAA
ncbi:hypothetical protein [Roseibium album]|uniref:hypothetical protein n=1 Tax=Roseibium album TaxID=311410 RepID=UPI00391C41FC